MLIIEDGSLVSNANSYVTVSEFQDYCSLRGLSFPQSSIECERLLILAMDYLERLHYQGKPVSSSQLLKFPRFNVYIDRVLQSDLVIPQAIRYSQMELASAQSSVSILQDGTNPSDNVKSEKVGELETSYYENGKNSKFTSERVNSILYPYLRQEGLVRI